MLKASRTFLLGVISLAFAIGCASAATSEGGPEAVEVSGSEAVAMLDERIVLDVRTPGEFATGHIAGALNIPVEAADFGDRIGELDREAAYLVYCRTGRRSAIAADQMTAAGFTDVADAGGLADLVAAGAPVE